MKNQLALVENNNKNNMEVVSMNKTQLRSLLSRQYGVTLSPSEFKSASKEDLINMVEKAKKESEIKINGGSEAMENNKGNVEENIKGELEMLDYNALLGGDPLKEVIEKLDEQTLNVNIHTTSETDRTIETLTKEIQGLKNTILSMKRVDVSPNKAANRNNRGKKYVICADCGLVIRSPRVEEYSKKKFGKPLCPTCQNKLRDSKKVKNINKDGSIVKTCMCCGKKISFSSVTTLNEKVKGAIERGLTPIACVDCWTKEMQVKGLNVKDDNKGQAPSTVNSDNNKNNTFTNNETPIANTSAPVNEFYFTADPTVIANSNNGGAF